jgi:hypothetical protein
MNKYVEVLDLEAGEKDPLLGQRQFHPFEVEEGETEEIFDSSSLVAVLLPLFALGLMAVGYLLAEQEPIG